MKIFTGKILSLVFLVNLLFIQGVNISEARELPAVINQINDSHKHYSPVESFCGTMSILAETDESDNDHKLMTGDIAVDPVKFLSGYIISSYSPDLVSQPSVDRSVLFSQQGRSRMQVYCSFLI